MSEAEETADEFALRQSKIIFGLMAEVKTLRERNEGLDQSRQEARTRMSVVLEEASTIIRENIELEAEVVRLRARVAELEAGQAD